MKIKLLTGQVIYETAQAVNGNSRITNAWADADTDAQKVYNEVAKRLNEDLGLLEEPVRSQESNTIVHEKGVYFILGYGPGEHDFATIMKFENINKSIGKYVLLQEWSYHHFYIRVCRMGQDIGHGSYDKVQDGRALPKIIVIQESGAAVGLNDAIDEYAWNERMLDGSTIL